MLKYFTGRADAGARTPRIRRLRDRPGQRQHFLLDVGNVLEDVTHHALAGLGCERLSTWQHDSAKHRQGQRGRNQYFHHASLRRPGLQHARERWENGDRLHTTRTAGPATLRARLTSHLLEEGQLIT